MKKNGLWLLVALLPALVFAQAGDTNARNNGDTDGAAKGPKAEPGKVIRIQHSRDKTDINTYTGRVFTLKHARAGEVAPLIERIVAAEGGNVSTVASTNQLVVTAPAHMLESLAEVVASLDHPQTVHESGLVRWVYAPKHRSARAVARLIRTFGEGASVVVDHETNRVIVTCPPSVKARLMELLGETDAALPQVRIEVRVVSATEEEFAKLGPDWDAWKRQIAGGVVVKRTKSAAFLPAAAYTLAAGGTGATLRLDAGVLTGLINVTAQSGKAWSVVSHTIVAKNGVAAHVGDHGDPRDPLALGVRPTIGSETVTVALTRSGAADAFASSVTLRDKETAVVGGFSRIRRISSGGPSAADEEQAISIVLITASFGAEPTAEELKNVERIRGN